MVESTGVQRSFGLVPQVKIQAVDDQDVSFSTRSASRSGDAKDSLLRTFTVPRTEVYTTPIPGAPTSVQMESGATGPLYLSSEAWNTRTPDGYGIYGANRMFGKFPNEGALPAPPMTRLVVVPTSIWISGHLEGEAEFFDLEVLGPEAADVQDIVWNSADYLEVQLTDQGARRLRVKARSTTVKVWPIKLVIKGAPSFDPSVTGEVSVQRLGFARPGAPITLALTPDGVGAFHVTPQAVAEQASSPAATQPATAA